MGKFSMRRLKADSLVPLSKQASIMAQTLGGTCWSLKLTVWGHVGGLFSAAGRLVSYITPHLLMASNI